MTATVTQFPLPASDAKDLGDILIAAKRGIQCAKGNFDRMGDVQSSILMIGPLNYIGVAIEMLAAERTSGEAWSPIATLMHVEPDIVLWNPFDGKIHPLNIECGPLTLEHIRQGNVFTHWRKVERPAS